MIIFILCAEMTSLCCNEGSSVGILGGIRSNRIADTRHRMAVLFRETLSSNRSVTSSWDWGENLYEARTRSPKLHERDEFSLEWPVQHIGCAAPHRSFQASLRIRMGGAWSGSRSRARVSGLAYSGSRTRARVVGLV